MTNPVHPVEQHYLDLTRRRFFGTAAKSVGSGLGATALASLLGGALGGVAVGAWVGVGASRGDRVGAAKRRGPATRGPRRWGCQVVASWVRRC